MAAFSLLIIAAGACGGGSGTIKSNLAMRAFVTDDIDGTIHIEDAQRDLESGFTIATGANPGTMVLSADKSLTLVFNSGPRTLSVVNNSTEMVSGSIALSDVSTSYVVLSDDATAFAAIPNATTCGTSITANGCIVVLDVKTNFNITQSIKQQQCVSCASPGPIPLNRPATLVLSPDGKKLLAFGAPASGLNTVTVIDTATASTSPDTAAIQFGPANCPSGVDCLDVPVWAVFSGDSTKAIVINCGPECGGTTASITQLDMTTSPPTPGTNVPIQGGASTALGVSNTLYVAGTAGGSAGQGNLSVLDVTNLGPPTTVASIGDGFHNHIELASNNQLFIGATNCTTGCLSIWDAAARPAKATFDAANAKVTGDVTGIAPINNRNVVYVIQDVIGINPPIISRGELRIYDTTTKALTTQQIDVVGKAVDVKYVDK